MLKWSQVARDDLVSAEPSEILGLRPGLHIEAGFPGKERRRRAAPSHTRELHLGIG